jgi:hypothetical protein
MIQVNEKCMGVYHRLVANKPLKGMKTGDMKDCLIMVQSDNRVAVMGLFMPHIGVMDEFYVVLPDIDSVHQAFTEQFTNIPGFSGNKKDPES